MERTYRTKEEIIAYFKQLSFEFETEAHKNNNDPFLEGKAEAYRLAAFEFEHNMK